MNDRAKRLMSQGYCVICGAVESMESLKGAGMFHQLCETCYLTKLAGRRLGHRSLWTALKQRLESQCRRCAYTGIKLILGENDSLDHIKPVHHFPNLRADPNNTEWVCREVNEMKRDRTPEEFLSIIRTILTYRGPRVLNVDVSLHELGSRLL